MKFTEAISNVTNVIELAGSPDGYALAVFSEGDTNLSMQSCSTNRESFNRAGKHLSERTQTGTAILVVVSGGEITSCLYGTTADVVDMIKANNRNSNEK